MSHDSNKQAGSDKQALREAASPDQARGAQAQGEQLRETRWVDAVAKVVDDCRQEADRFLRETTVRFGGE